MLYMVETDRGALWGKMRPQKQNIFSKKRSSLSTRPQSFTHRNHRNHRPVRGTMPLRRWAIGYWWGSLLRLCALLETRLLTAELV